MHQMSVRFVLRIARKLSAGYCEIMRLRESKLVTGCRRAVPGILVAVAVLAAAGCARSAQVASTPVCPMPKGYDLRKAADLGMQTVRTCPYTFEQVFQALLDISKHDPKAENLTVFVDFVDTLEQEKVIPFKETKILFKSYFGSDLVSVSSDYSVYAHRGRLDQVLAAVDAEMEKKRVGYVDVLGDVRGYQRLQRQSENFKRALATLSKTLP